MKRTANNFILYTYIYSLFIISIILRASKRSCWRKKHTSHVNIYHRRKEKKNSWLKSVQKSSHLNTLIFFLIILTHALHLHLQHKNNNVLRYYR